MSSQSAKNGKLTREEKREEKRKKKGSKPGYFAQMKQVFTMTRKSDPNITWILLLAGLVTLLVFLLVGVLFHNWITWLIIGVPVAVLVWSA